MIRYLGQRGKTALKQFGRHKNRYHCFRYPTWVSLYFLEVWKLGILGSLRPYYLSNYFEVGVLKFWGLLGVWRTYHIYKLFHHCLTNYILNQFWVQRCCPPVFPGTEKSEAHHSYLACYFWNLVQGPWSKQESCEAALSFAVFLPRIAGYHVSLGQMFPARNSTDLAAGTTGSKRLRIYHYRAGQ